MVLVSTPTGLLPSSLNISTQQSYAHGIVLICEILVIYSFTLHIQSHLFNCRYTKSVNEMGRLLRVVGDQVRKKAFVARFKEL